MVISNHVIEATFDLEVGPVPMYWELNLRPLAELRRSTNLMRIQGTDKYHLFTITNKDDFKLTPIRLPNGELRKVEA